MGQLEKANIQKAENWRFGCCLKLH